MSELKNPWPRDRETERAQLPAFQVVFQSFYPATHAAWLNCPSFDHIWEPPIILEQQQLIFRDAGQLPGHKCFTYRKALIVLKTL